MYNETFIYRIKLYLRSAELFKNLVCLNLASLVGQILVYYLVNTVSFLTVTIYVESRKFAIVLFFHFINKYTINFSQIIYLSLGILVFVFELFIKTNTVAVNQKDSSIQTENEEKRKINKKVSSTTIQSFASSVNSYEDNDYNPSEISATSFRNTKKKTASFFTEREAVFQKDFFYFEDELKLENGITSTSSPYKKIYSKKENAHKRSYSMRNYNSSFTEKKTNNQVIVKLLNENKKKFKEDKNKSNKNEKDEKELINPRRSNLSTSSFTQYFSHIEMMPNSKPKSREKEREVNINSYFTQFFYWISIIVIKIVEYKNTKNKSKITENEENSNSFKTEINDYSQLSNTNLSKNNFELKKFNEKIKIE